MLNVAVIGVGHLGRHHARILSEISSVNLAAVVDPNQQQGETVAASCNTQWRSELNGLEHEIDMAIVAVPTVLHEKCTMPLLNAKVACLIEKPMAPDPETCQRILDCAKLNDTFVAVGHVERFNPAIKRAIELGIDARFIEAHRLAPYSFRSTDVGVVLDLMIHDIDLANAWTGSEVVAVDAVGGATFSPSEDIASARISYANGAVANLTASRLSLKPMRRFRVFSPDSYLSLDSQNKYALLVKKADNFSQEMMAKIMGSENPQAEFGNLLDIEELHLDDDEPLRAELTEFIAAVQGKESSVVTGTEGMQAVTVAHQVMKALSDCQWG
ncbi:MAG: Gfo/Idh/MocA family oxidoreductase [Planctomycetes bacterium]|nr:Gfo/Idh/MocA family oxidoreductase [Planctomycetota bacterium]